MTDDKTPEENRPIDEDGQYVFYRAQDVLDGTAEQEAQEGMTLEEVLDKALADARERRNQLFMDMQELLGEEHIAEGGGEPNKKQVITFFALLTLDDWLNSKSFRELSLEVLREKPGRDAEVWVDFQERDLLSFLLVAARDMFAYKEKHPELSLFSIWRQGIDDEESEPGKILHEAAEWYKANRDELKRRVWEEPPPEDGVDFFMEALPTLPSIKPSALIMPNSTLMNDLAGVMGHRPINAGEYDLPVIPATKRQREITTFVMAAYEPEKGITSSLSEYERDVSDAFMSIWEQARKDGKKAVFTPETIYRAMPGRGDQPSTQQKGAITKAIEKFRHLELEVDATEELRKRGKIGAGDVYHIKDFYLRAAEHTYKAKSGQAKKGWEMTAEPLVLSYAKMTGQLLTVPAKYLAIEKIKQGAPSGELLTMTAGRQAMTSYMLRRIAVMKRDNETAKDRLRAWNKRRSQDPTMEEKPLEAFREQSRTILFAAIFDKAGIDTANRKQQMLNRNFCLDVLDYWKATGYIKGYRQQAKGRSITGVEIQVE